MIKKRLTLGATSVFVLAALALSGCAPSDTAATTGTGSGDAATLAAFTAEAQALVDSKTGEQTVTPPTEGPAAVTGKKIMVIPCAMGAEGCSRPANATVEAAKAIGWTATINDPGGDPTKMADAVAQAIASKYDAIVLTAIDAQTIQGALTKAKAAGLLVGDFAAKDVESGDKLIDANIPPESDFFDAGYAMAAKMFIDHGPKLNVIALTGTEFGSIRLRLEGTKKFIEDCVAAGGECALAEEQNFLVTELTTTLPGQAAALVRSHPDANALWIGYDAGANFAMQGIEDAKLSIDTYSFDANVANITRIANGQTQIATAGSAMQWIGYGIIDTFNRIWSGQDAVVQGPTFKLLTKDNVVSGKAWDGDISVADTYKSIWQK